MVMRTDVRQLLLYHDLIAGVVAAMEARDSYTANHSMRVAEMTEALCRYEGLSEEQTTVCHIAAHLHDIGKIGIADAVLRKADRLDEAEWEQMKSHTLIGYGILHRIDCFDEIARIVRAHHERWDGGGYPDALAGTDISRGARLIAVADSIDAMLSSRTYRGALSPEYCRNEIEKNSGRMYDPEVASAALKHWTELLERREKTSLIFRAEHLKGEAS